MAIQQGVDTGLWGAARLGYELGDYGRMVLWVYDYDSEILWCNKGLGNTGFSESLNCSYVIIPSIVV